MINIIRTFDTHYQPRDLIGAHNHTFFHYIYVYDGDGEITVDHIKMDLSVGLIYLVRPLMMHEFAAGEKGLSTIEVKFDVNDSGLFAKMCLFPMRMNVEECDVDSILKKMVHETLYDDNYSKSMTDIKLYELITTLFRISE